MPRSLSELLALRVTGLSAKATATLQLASVLGREFDSELLALLPDGADLADRGCLEELVARQLLEWVGPDRYRSVHHKLREAQEDTLGLPIADICTRSLPCISSGRATRMAGARSTRRSSASIGRTRANPPRR